MAVAAAIAATISYGFAVNYSKRRLAGVKPLVVAFGSQFYASLLLLPLAALVWPRHAVSSLAWIRLVSIGVVCTAFAYVLYFRLIENVNAPFAASVTYIVPLFGVAWGRMFLNESITRSTVFGGVIILFGTALASGRLALTRRVGFVRRARERSSGRRIGASRQTPSSATS